MSKNVHEALILVHVSIHWIRGVEDLQLEFSSGREEERKKKSEINGWS